MGIGDWVFYDFCVDILGGRFKIVLALVYVEWWIGFGVVRYWAYAG